MKKISDTLISPAALTTNCRYLAVLVVCPLGLALLVSNFLLDRTASLSAMYFSTSFGGSHRRFSLSRSFSRSVLISILKKA